MRIMILTSSIYPEPGGVERYTFNLSESLAQNGHQVLVFTLTPPDRFIRPCQNLMYLPVRRWGSVKGRLLDQLWQKIYLIIALDRAVARFCPNEMICTWWDPLGYLVAFIGHWRGIPYICVGYGQEVIQFSGRPFLKRFKGFLRRLAFRCATRVVAISHFTREHIIQLGVNPEHVQVVPPGLTPDYVREASTFSRQAARDALGLDGYIILQVGRLVPRKGHESVLEALATVQRELDAPVSYVVAGSGPCMDALKKKARDMRLEEHTIFTGFVPEDRLHLYYSAADIMVMPPYNPDHPGDVEGFGIVYLEAYAHARPVIGTSAGGVPDAILHGETGLLIPPGDSEALADGILYLLRDPPRSARMGVYGQQLVHTRWNWNQLCNEFIL